MLLKKVKTKIDGIYSRFYLLAEAKAVKILKKVIVTKAEK